MSAHYWGIGWLAWVQNSRSLLFVCMTPTLDLVGHAFHTDFGQKG